MGRGCLFAIRNSQTATGSRVPLPSSSRQRPIARPVVRASSPRNPSSRNTTRLPFLDMTAGIVAWPSAEDLPPFRALEQAVLDTALARN